MTVLDRTINDLISLVERHPGSAPIQRTGDPFMDLAEVKTVIANKPMDGFDEANWWKADQLQKEVLDPGPRFCLANVPYGMWQDCNAAICGKSVVAGTDYCEKHQIEN